MACLVTGGTGFIGAHVVRRLLQQREKVIAYDLLPDIKALERLLGKEELNNVMVVQGDILDLPYLVRTARRNNVDKIVHLAYIVGRPTELNPAMSTRINIEGTNNVFETGGIVGARRVVWASSIAVFGPKSAAANGVVANDAPYHPATIYGACKVTNELVAHRYAVSHGLEPVGLRLPVVYGPAAVRGWASFLSNLISNLVKGLSAEGPRLERPLLWIYVEDVAEAVLLALGIPKTRPLVFNLGGEVRSAKEAVEIVARFFPQASIGVMEGYPDLYLMAHFDTQAAREVLGWQLKYPLEEGIRQMIDYYRRNQEPPPTP